MKTKRLQAVRNAIARSHGMLTLSELADQEGFDSVHEMIAELGSDSVMPALCIEGCQVEPDGYCPHGHPSILLAAGII